MSNFIKNIIIFSIFPIIFFTINYGINSYICFHQSLPIKKVQILIAGDSHTQYGINPSVIGDAQNISQSAEPYIITFWKLKKIFKSHKPNILILGFSPHNISEFNDFKFSKPKWSYEMFKRSYTIEQFNDINNKIPIDYLTFYKVLWKQCCLLPKTNHIYYIGNYVESYNSNISDWKSAIKRHYYFNDKELSVSETAVNYLDSIVILCKKENVSLILAGPPVSENYYKHIPQSIKKEYHLLYNKYKHFLTKINDTETNYPDSLFLDSDHLNSYGANRFSKEILNKINLSRNKARTHNN
jgi:hypothetical protein